MITRYFLFFLFGTVSALLIVLLLGTLLSAPNRTPIGPPPPELGGQNVQFRSDTKKPLFGWYVEGAASRAGILLLHGVRSNRMQMVERAIFLKNSGYSVLLFDFQAHGESPGEYITYGYLESKDADAAFSYLRKKLIGKNIGIIGVSLGGAAALMSQVSQHADALVIEAVFPTLKQAVTNRITMRLGSYGAYLAPLLIWQVEPRLGFDPKLVSPIDYIPDAKTPLLVIGGTKDQYTPLSESKSLYDAARSPKHFWAIDGAAHEDFQHFAPIQYEKTILDFFDRYL